MPRQYEPLTLARQADYAARFAACPQPASDYSFVNIWGWAEEYGLEWSWDEDLIWIRQTRPEPVCWAPVADWRAVDWDRRLSCLAEAGTFIRVPEALVEIWQERLGGRISAAEARGHWDYLYDREELVELKGNKFHKKKNLLKQFQKTYSYEYQELTPDCVEEALQLQNEWCSWRECEDSHALVAENAVIGRVLKSWDRIGSLIGGALHIDGHMAAYTVAEPLSADTLVIHFEKAKPGFKGIYQAINQMFLETSAEGFARVNREQDLDDEGLRKAKMSYNPVAFLKKFTVTVRA
jgi:hypothetical protein